jgi:hypothetical protein
VHVMAVKNEASKSYFNKVMHHKSIKHASIQCSLQAIKTFRFSRGTLGVRCVSTTQPELKYLYNFS